LGYDSPQELVGVLGPDLYADPKQKKTIQDELTKKGYIEDMEIVLKKKNGTPVHVLGSTTLQRDHQGKPIRVESIWMDITERKQAEETLRRSEQKYRTLIENVPQKVFYKDKNSVYISCNNNYAIDLKINPDQITGKTDYDFFPRYTAEKHTAHDRRVIESNKAETFEERYIKNGEERFIETFRTPVRDEKGDVVGVLGIFQDISERKRMQEQLVVTDRLASVGEMASGMAHELNNPLTSVIGLSQLLMESEISGDVKEDVEAIYKEAQRAATVTKNLLAFARKHEPVRQHSQVNRIIEDVLKLRNREHTLNNIEVFTHLDAQLPEIMADPFQMQQVFLNIILNAESAMTEAHHKGTLDITTKRADGHIKISFADDGPGISADIMGKIFNPFFTTKEVGKGTGLGLSICYGIVANHGGKIYAESKLGDGATFVVELPMNP
jgi:PAS domain S-box-containing protein